MESDSITLEKNIWMFAPWVQDKRFPIKIEGTQPGNGALAWKDGIYEGKNGIYRGSRGTNGIVVLNRETTLDVPEQYLSVERPTTEDQFVILLHGENAGNIYKVVAVQDNQCKVKPD